MAHYVTESIWHFVGYMHLAELLSKTPLHYSGAGIYGLQTIQHSPAAPVGYAGLELPDDGHEGLSASIELPAERHLTFLSRPLTIKPSPAPLDEADRIAFKPPAVKPPLDLARELPGVTHTVFVSAHGRTKTEVTEDAPLPKISVTYTVGESQVNDIHIAQANALLDADVLRGDPAALLEAGLDAARLDALNEGSAELAGLVQKAMDLLAEDVIPASPADGIERVHASNDGTLKVGLPEGSDVVAEAVGTGRYVNGEHIGDAGTSQEVIEAQVAKIEAAVGAAQPVLPDLGETHVSSDGPVHIVTGPEPTGGPAHEAVAGGNDAVNAAVLYDLADAAGSMIVRGDVHVTDVIVQVNVLQDNDTVNAGADALGTAIVEAAIAAGVEAGAIGGNAVTNEAAFVQEAGSVFGDVALGGIPGALNWQVDYVQGSLFDLTTVKQYNLVIDTDAVEQTTTGTHFVATLGENGALNLVQLQELGTSYDLIIIGGDYRELNAIIQANVLLDDDSVDQAAGDGTAAQSIDTEGNTLTNDAAIVRIGGDSYKPLGGDPEALADAIGSMQTDLDSSLATGLPGNGTDTLKVLYVTGDYYDYNILLQTNVVDDSDEIVQASAAAPAPAADEGEDGEEPAASAQTADAGGNALQNLALLVNVDSTSDYQYVGGEVYEDTLLVQGEIIIDEDDGNATDLHPDVVAALAAQSGSVDDPSPSGDATVDQPHTGADADVMGGVLA